MKARTQKEHAKINAREYPGTRQMCYACGFPTGNCEEDALYTDDGEGPLCEECYDKKQEETEGKETMSKPDSKLIKITLEYEDHVYFLEGNELCTKWKKAIDGVLQLHQVRGYPIKGLEETEKYWKREEKRESHEQ